MRLRWCVYLVVLTISGVGDAWAGAGADNEIGHDRALKAVTDGEILPLHVILQGVQERVKGAVVGVVLVDQEEGLHGWVYDVKVYTEGGGITLLRVDATTGSILRIDKPEGF
ncbi:MAG: peptidase M4 [Alphaproteobacteria bacterium GM202ARS2]|nr:peptidase M4 [Alphaproteobacteria bacterium GM202ARS2]